MSDLSKEENFITINDNILQTADLNYKPTVSLGEEFFKMMKLNSKKVAQYNAESGETETYGQLLLKCIQTSIKLRSENVTEVDIICLCTYNHMNAIVPFIAGTFIGAQVASLDPSLSLEDTTHLLKQVQPKIIFLVQESIELIEGSIRNAKIDPKLVIFGESDVYNIFYEYLEENLNEETDFRPIVKDPKKTQVIFFSSGTTGLPKGICQNSYALLCQAVNHINNGYMIGPTLSYSSLYWISSALLLTCNIISGTARVVIRMFDPKVTWNLIPKFQISFMFLAPIQAIEVTRVGRPENIDTSSLQIVTTGGGALSKQQMDAFKDLLPGAIVSQIYGQTEIAGILTSFTTNTNDIRLAYFKPTSCGRPVRGIWYKVVDLETEALLGPNQKGELRVKTEFVMNGYYNLDASDSFDNDGWLRTGDIVYYDEDFCFYVIDRIKELLKYKSWHIAPATVENVVKQHPAVDKVVVIGRPDEVDGDLPLAVIIKKDGFDDVTSEQIQCFANEQLVERNQLRGGVVFVKSFPMTPSGKVKRQTLKYNVLLLDN